MEPFSKASSPEGLKAILRFPPQHFARLLCAVPLALLFLTTSCTELSVAPVGEGQPANFSFPTDVNTQWIYKHEESYWSGMMFKTTIVTRGRHVWTITSKQATSWLTSCVIRCVRYDTTYMYQQRASPPWEVADTAAVQSFIDFPVTVSNWGISLCWHWTIDIDQRDSLALSLLPRLQESFEVNTEFAKAKFENNVGLVEYDYSCGTQGRRLTLISGPTQ